MIGNSNATALTVAKSDETNVIEGTKNAPIIQISRYDSHYSREKGCSVPGCIPHDTDLYTELDKIKNGYHRQTIQKLRELPTEEDQKRFKCQSLESLTISCVTKKWRKLENVISHPGALNIDIDGDGNEHITDWNEVRQQMVKDMGARLVAAFLSCRANGLVLVFRIDPKFHKQTFEFISHSLKKKYNINVDTQCSDITRLRFVSDDPEAYINYDWDNIPVIIPTEIYLQEKKKLLADTPKPKIVKVGAADTPELFKNAVKVAEYKFKVDTGVDFEFIPGNRHRYLCSIAGYCNTRGMTEDYCIALASEQYHADGYDISRPIKSTYKTYADQHGTIDAVGGEVISTFWEVINTKKGKNLNFNRSKFIDFLYDYLGISLYYYSGNKYTIIRSVNNIEEEISTEQIKQLVKEYILSLPETFDQGTTPEELFDFVMRGSNTWFSEAQMEWLPHMQPDFLKHTPTTAYYPFVNGVVCITAEEISIKTFEELGKSIWKDEQKAFNISLQEYNISDGDFFKFLCCSICGEPEYEKLSKEQVDKLFYALSIIGYILHTYKDPSRPYGIVFCEETESEEKGGGTGKGILTKAPAQLLNVITIDGKTHSPNKSFANQRVTLSTKLIVWEDLHKKHDIELQYNPLTEGMTVEKKNKDEFFIPYADSPKMIFTTNYTVRLGAESAKRRIRLLEFAPFFSSRYTPEDHFGHKLYHDWDHEEWNRFYNLMFYCVQLYLKEGIVLRESSDVLKYKQIRNGYSSEFVEWFKEYIADKPTEPSLFYLLYEGFLKRSDLDEKDYSKKRFKTAIREAGELFGWSVKEERSSENRAKIQIWLEK